MVAQIHHQQRYIAALEAENRELRRQLAELRRGVGVTVTIQGQTMSLTAPVATVVSQSTEPVDTNITGILPLMTSTGSYPTPTPPAQPGPQTPPRTWNHSAYRQYGQGQTPAESGEYSENAWLTGEMRRVSPVSRPQQQPPATEQPRPLSPSQQVTPLWLREEPREWPSLTTPQATPSRRPPVSRPAMPQQQQTPLRYSQQGQESFDSLARLTGHHPIMRSLNERQQPPSNERNPYTDSFVLG
jgi:hypothetical protein